MNEIKYGAIALMDMLGTKGIWQHYDYNLILKDWTDIKNKLKIGFKNAAKLNPNKALEYKIHSFSDTFIIILQSEEGNTDALLQMGIAVGSAFNFALKRGILFRGAISFGKYMSKENMIIGPAIDDVAEWYEISDWVGIHLTPSAGFAFEKIGCDEDYCGRILCRYDIPTNKFEGGQKKFKGWAVNWPTLFLMESSISKLIPLSKKIDPIDTNPTQIRELLYDVFSKRPIYGQNISKYQNTIDFVEHTLTNSNKKI